MAALALVATCVHPTLADVPPPRSDGSSGSATEAASNSPFYSLQRCLVLAEQNHPNVWQARERLRAMRAQLDEAHTAPFSQFTLTGGLAVAPTLRGTALYSPDDDVSLSKNFGVAWRVGVEGIVPLWTFGKITNLWDAAEAQIKVGESDIQKQRNLVKMDVRKAYYGLKTARDSLALLDEATDKLDKALAHLESEVLAGNADDVDLLKLKTFRYEIDGRKAEAHRYEAIARSSLAFLTGVTTSLDVSPEPVRAPVRVLSPVTSYLEAARLHRPEVNMVRAGILAREAQVDLARARLFPDLGIGMSATWARAPQVADQINAFVRDDANYLRYGAALVARWQLDFLPNAARIEQARAQLEELRQTQRYALGGVGVEVETAYAQVVDAAAREKAFSMAAKTARQWIIAVQQGIDIGTRDDKDLADAARQWALQRFSHITALMDLNLAWASLALATGWDQISPADG